MNLNKSKITFVILCTFLCQSVVAACNISSPNNLLEVIKNKHPSISENKASVEVASKWAEVAEQRPNPELQTQGMKGEEIDGDVDRLGLSLMHTFELGGKRSSRIDYAKSRHQFVKSAIESSSENILIDAIMKAYRLRQVKELIAIYQDAYSSFQSLHQTISQRRSLSPEEKVEEETILLVMNDLKLKISKLNSEEEHLNKLLLFYIDEDCKLTRTTLPKSLNLSKEFDLNMSAKSYSKLQMASMTLEAKKRKLQLEKSNVYPDLKVGPAFDTETINGESYQSIGLTLSMEIPFLNTNKGSRQLAVKEINRAKLQLRNAEREANVELETWINKYNSFKASLKLIANEDAIKKKRSRIKALFKRGVIPTSMIIESQRQLIEFASTRYDYELGAVEALWHIYKINGTIFNETL